MSRLLFLILTLFLCVSSLLNDKVITHSVCVCVCACACVCVKEILHATEHKMICF